MCKRSEKDVSVSDSKQSYFSVSKSDGLKDNDKYEENFGKESGSYDKHRISESHHKVRS
ncbi:Uncharacterized protein dnm_012270 [Desulfonema magnum]|uniref:Uncharacterized protein n=1 Tax=Desulfonema magnum TaxID=45655 RepID=A0A975BGR6_9BACT|nr:Uncharacterized protein dnm_012270 [Desulfonema magnum]